MSPPAAWLIWCGKVNSSIKPIVAYRNYKVHCFSLVSGLVQAAIKMAPLWGKEILVKIKEFICRIKPPCPEYPYTLGLVHTLANPGPGCRENGYRTFGRSKRGLPERPDDAET